MDALAAIVLPPSSDLGARSVLGFYLVKGTVTVGSNDADAEVSARIIAELEAPHLPLG